MPLIVWKEQVFDDKDDMMPLSHSEANSREKRMFVNKL